MRSFWLRDTFAFMIWFGVAIICMKVRAQQQVFLRIENLHFRSRSLNGTFPWRKCSIKTLLSYNSEQKIRYFFIIICLCLERDIPSKKMEMIGPQSNKYYKHQVPIISHNNGHVFSVKVNNKQQQHICLLLLSFFFFVMMMFCLPGIPSKDFDQKHQNCLWALKPMDHS